MKNASVAVALTAPSVTFNRTGHAREEPPVSLRARLVSTYIVVFVAGLVIFSLTAFAAVDGAVMADLDHRLGTSTHALVAITDRRSATLDARASAWLRSVLSNAQNAAIISRDGTITWNSAPVPAAVAKQANRSTLPSSYVTVEDGARPLRVMLSRAALGGRLPAVIAIWRPLDFVYDYLHITGLILTILLVAISTIALLIGNSVVHRALEPLRGMAAVAAEIEAFDLTRRLDAEADSELRQLSLAFNRMLDRLDAAFQGQRRFTANASHDLRAPLTVLMASVDIALRRERSAEKYRDTLVAVRAEVSQMDRLIDALLMLGETDCRTEPETVTDVGLMLSTVVSRMEAVAAASDISFDLVLPMRVCAVTQPTLFDRVLLVLLHNAIKFSRAGGRVKVESRLVGDYVRVSVRDAGKGFSNSALVHAFDRLWRDSSAMGPYGGGLGLPIARAAVESWGGTIDISNSPQGDGEVTLTLRSAVDHT